MCPPILVPSLHHFMIALKEILISYKVSHHWLLLFLTFLNMFYMFLLINLGISWQVQWSISGLILYWGKVMFRMQSYTSYNIRGGRAHHFCNSPIFVGRLFHLTYSQSLGRTRDLKPSQSAHFAPLCWGIASRLGLWSKESNSELVSHNSQALVWAVREEEALFSCWTEWEGI